MKAIVFLLLGLFALSATPYIDSATITLKQCLCMTPQWLYLDVWAHVSAGNGTLSLYWYDRGWQGVCNVGTGAELHNICSIPSTSSAVALVLYRDGVEVDRVEIWGIKPQNTTCRAVPMLYVLNRTTSYQQPLAVVTLRSVMLNTIAAVFHSTNYTVAKTLSIRGLNPCDDYIIKLVFHMPTPSPWRVEISGNASNTPTIITTKTITVTQTSIVTTTEVITYTVAKTITETLIKTESVTKTQTTTATETVRELDTRSVYIAALGVIALIIALIIFISAYLKK